MSNSYVQPPTTTDDFTPIHQPRPARTPDHGLPRNRQGRLIELTGLVLVSVLGLGWFSLLQVGVGV
jgi:hypothetical protein